MCGTRRIWAGVCVALALVGAATGQNPVPPPGVVDLTPPTLPGPAEPAVAIPEEEEEEGEALYRFSAEFLLLHARRRDLDYALSNPNAGNPFAPVGTILEMIYPIQGGLRVGVGYTGPSGLWDFAFNFTYYSSSDNQAAARPPGGSLFATQTRPGINVVNTAVASNYMRYRWFDLEFTRRVELESNATLKLLTGLRFLTLQDSMRVRYDGQDATLADVFNRHDAYGTGLLLGGLGEYRLGRRWRVDSFGRATLAYTHYRVQVRETDMAGATINTDATVRYKRVMPVLEFGFGIVWEAGGYRFRVGYELQNWFSAFDYPTFISDAALGKFLRRSSDLGVEGVVFSFSKAF